MNEQLTTVCPWCQTEIVWDEVLGPEDVCPHCFNELTDYRSISIDLDRDEDEEDEEDDSERSPEPLGEVPDEDLYTLPAYEAVARQIIDRQDELAECPSCGREMLYLGSAQRLRIEQPSPSASDLLADPATGDVPEMQLDAFVCPSCFRVETKLSEEDRLQLIRRLTESEEERR